MKLLAKFTGMAERFLNRGPEDFKIGHFEKEAISDVISRYEKRKNERRNLELQWRLNIAFYNGDQHAEIDAAWGDIRTIPAVTEYEERNVFNEIAPNIETKLALMNKRKNNMKCIPASQSSEDRTAAKIGDKVIASARRRLNFPQKKKLANYLAQLNGTAIAKTVWDSNAGKAIGYKIHFLSEEDEQKLPPEYRYESELVGRDPDKLVTQLHEGEAVTSILSPFEVFPENLALPLASQRRIMHVQLLSADEVLERWGAVEEGADNDAYRTANTEARNYGGAFGRVFGTELSVEKIHGTVKVFEEWELPSGRYPHGRLIVCTESNLLHYGELPDKYSVSGEYKLPFDVKQSLQTDGFFGKSVIERMISIQRSFNHLKNRIADYNNRACIGVYTAESGALVDEERLMEDGIAPGDIIFNRQGAHAIRALENSPLPGEIFSEANLLVEELNRVSGVSELSKQSSAPGNIVAASALAGLQEQDDTRIGLEVEEDKQFWAAIATKQLVLYRDNVKYPRIVKDIGKNEEFEVSVFKGSDLTSFDVTIEPEPEGADSLAQRRQKVIELMNAGLFSDPETGGIGKEDKARIFEMIELGNWEMFVEDDDKHLSRARRENQSMMAGEAAVIRAFDDDIIHIDSHNNFRLTSEYESALKENPELDKLFEAHVDQHLSNLNSKNGPQQQPDMTPYPMNASLQPGPAAFGAPPMPEAV